MPASKEIEPELQKAWPSIVALARKVIEVLHMRVPMRPATGGTLVELIPPSVAEAPTIQKTLAGRTFIRTIELPAAVVRFDAAPVTKI